MSHQVFYLGGLLLLIAGYISIASSTRYLPTSAIPFSVNGARVTFSNIPIKNGTTSKCIIRNPDNSSFDIEEEPAVTHDRKHATCRLPPTTTSGKVRVELEVKEGADTKVHTKYTILTAAPSHDLKVEEDWPNNRVEFSWNVNFFRNQFPPDHTIHLEAIIHIEEAGGTNFNPTSVNIHVGENADPGKIRVGLSPGNINTISNFRTPYFYLLRVLGSRNTYVTSEVFTPTMGITAREAQRICWRWAQANPNPPMEEEVLPCPDCHCKAVNDPDFVLTAYNPQIVKLVGGALANHQLFYQRTPSPSGYAQSCSYKAPDNTLATSPPTAAWVHSVSKDISYNANYRNDIYPYIVCCIQSQSDRYCDLFRQRRPTSTGHDYHGIDDPCHGHGDPHIVTFDGLKYGFMGYGEFWLVHGPGSEDGTFGVQGRMAPIKEGQKFSYFTGFAMRDGNTTVQVEHVGGALQIVLDGSYILDKANIPATLQVGNVSISVSGDTVAVRLARGISMNMRSILGNHFAVTGGAAIRNKGKGYVGIFGHYDGDMEDDFINRKGRLIPSSSDMSKIYNVFGLSWMTKANETFFTYGEGQNWSTHARPDFGPILEYPDPATMPEEVRALCKEDLACYYEYMATGQLEAAKEAVDAAKEFEEMKKENAKKVLTCPKLEAPINGRVLVGGYLPGSKANYSCHEGAVMTGDAEKTCKEVGDKAEWTAGKEPVCTWSCESCTKDVEYGLSHDPSACAGFVVCLKGKKHPLKCTPGQNWNREEQQCEKDYQCVDPPAC